MVIKNEFKMNQSQFQSSSNWDGVVKLWKNYDFLRLIDN